MRKGSRVTHLLPCGPKNFTTNSLSPLRMVTSCLLSMLGGRGAVKEHHVTVYNNNKLTKHTHTSRRRHINDGRILRRSSHARPYGSTFPSRHASYDNPKRGMMASGKKVKTNRCEEITLGVPSDPCTLLGVSLSVIIDNPAANLSF